MRLVRTMLGAALLLAGAVALTSGAPPFGRVLITAGLPGLASTLLSDPTERGAALYRAGRFDEAAADFAEAGDLYNRGLAAARAGAYSTALAAWDARLIEAPGDQDARRNYDLLAQIVAGTELEALGPIPRKTGDGPEIEAAAGQGGARAAGMGDAAQNLSTALGMAELTGSGLRQVPKIFDAQFLSASERWLTTLSDEPGVYLSARIAAEAKAREAAGTAPPLAEDPR